MIALFLVVAAGLTAYVLTRAPSSSSSPAAPAPAQPSAQPAQQAMSTAAPAVKAESPKPTPGSLAQPAAPLALPRYPVGLEVRFAGKKAVIKKAWQDGQGGWHFLVDLDAGLFFRATDKAVSEQFMRDTISNQLKQPLAPEQAFPQGVEVYRGGQGGLIERVSRAADGVYVYQLKGWPAPVTQGQLLDLLVKA